MSFSRAKLTRFNEKLPCTPSPADYNVKIGNKTAGAVIPKTERFPDIKSPLVSESGSIKSMNSTPCFRTPTLPKKKKSIFASFSARKTKPTDLFKKKDEPEIEALKEKIVECKNKDQSIKDLTEQIEEMKELMCCLKRQKIELVDDCNRFKETATELKEEQRMVLERIYLEHDQEILDLKNKIQKSEVKFLRLQEEERLLNEQKEKLIQDTKESLNKHKTLYEETLEKLNEEIKSKEAAVAEADKIKTELVESIEKLERSHASELEKIKRAHKEEMMQLEFEMLKTVTEMQSTLDKEINCNKEKIVHLEEHKKKEIDTLQINFKEEKEQIFNDNYAKLKQIQEDNQEAIVLAEMQLQEKLKDVELSWKIKLEEQMKESEAILKECQAISEYNIIQCELEKKSIKLELDAKLEELGHLVKENADLEISCKDLELKVRDYEKTITTYNEDIKYVEQIGNDLRACRKDLQDSINQKKMFEISISKSHEAIETLKKRLLNSDRDVEQLTAELEVCELSKLETEGKCNQLAEELNVVVKLNEDLEYKHEQTVKENQEQILNIHNQLMERIDYYKEKLENEVHILTDNIKDKQMALDDAMEQLHDQQAANIKSSELLGCAQINLEELEVERDMLQDQIKNRENECEAANAENKDLNRKLNKVLEDCENMKKRVEDYEEKIDEIQKLMKIIAQLNDKNEYYVKYCDYYKMKCSDYENEVGELQCINKKYIEQSGKYDCLLQKYETLQNENNALQNKISEQSDLIGPFRDQLESYELEHRELLNQKSEAELEAKNIGMKYAQLLGNQNHREKIKHLNKLQAQNYTLNESNKEMEIKMKSQARMIEKLKRDLADLTKSPRKTKIHGTDKENLNSPNRTLNSSRIESPGGPLRERN
ncbi:PREDICTED: hyaluronan mediated motility receptor-like [Nicrophorus vespilloides]|uniref:Hyaluronan mediated motility receptor-like n=1 Tax=Nicrophorus vespilloides TaxID=110193 RepID=A0ABM1NAQ0_NICVS|nr:PREDICTED: hyaluronan mediated motility receptor-like [Nicrophorus vespilloides]